MPQFIPLDLPKSWIILKNWGSCIIQSLSNFGVLVLCENSSFFDGENRNSKIWNNIGTSKEDQRNNTANWSHYGSEDNV